MGKNEPRRETALYPPVRDYLQRLGYTVRSEVLGCDITATRDDELVVIELKRAVNLELLAQATRRQRLTASVYVAIPLPEDFGGKKWRGIQHILRRLELGLILVSFGVDPPRVEVAFHPVPFDRKKQHAQRRAVLREAGGRSLDLNTGGSTRQKLVTAYRENAIRIAAFLEDLGPQSPKALAALGTGKKTRDILYHNVYGWFDRIDRGVYALSAAGREALAEYPDLVLQFREQLSRIPKNT